MAQASRRLSGSAIGFVAVLALLVVAYVVGAFVWGRGWWDLLFAVVLAVLVVLFSFGLHALARRRGGASGP